MIRYFSIPHCYVWMTEGCENRKGLFRRYVQAYLRKTHPGWKLLKIEGMKAKCENAF